mgnify:CR=1 FL=1
MKTSIFTKAFALIIMAMISLVTMAEQIEIDGIIYEVHDDKLEVLEHPDKYSGVVIIPDTVIYGGKKFTVTQINIAAFRNCKDLLSVGISATVNDMDAVCFYGCESLEEIYVDPNNTTYTSYDRALYNKDMTSILMCPVKVGGEFEIPDGVVYIAATAFKKCNLLTSIILPETVKSISSSAFDDCSSLTSINLPDSITSIGEGSFAGCSVLADINIPGSLTEIGNRAFASCAIKEVHLHDKVTDMGMGIFQSCSKLENVTLPESMTDLPESTFMSCRNLKEIVLPDGITSIGIHAFSGCKSLKSIDLPKNIKEISRYGFRNCTSLQSITIPESVETFGYGAFSGCDTLNDVTNLSRIPQDIDDNTFTHYRTLHVPAGSEQLYAVAEGWKNFNIVGDAPAHDGINDIEAGTKQTQAPAQYYGIDGKRLTTASPKGITIVKTGDGKTKKITSRKRQ